jgi:leader peptidase (prepilin peptidase) / N-methyltransferase
MAYLLIFLFGLIWGSFLNVVIFRLRENEQFFFGRSHCRTCGRKLEVRDLIPVISFVLSGGKCRYCSKRLSLQYPAVELVTAGLFLLNFYFFNLGMLGSVELGRNFVLISVLIVIFVYDLRWLLVSDAIVVPSIIFFSIFSLFSGRTLTDLIIALGLGFSFFAVQYYFSGGKWLGSGDLRLGLLLGAVFSWPQVLLALFLTYLIGGAISVALLLSGKVSRKTPLPLGVFISLSALITLFFGEALVNWYLTFLWF